MVNFRKICEDNFWPLMHMKQPEDQHFVAPNSISLAQAWLYRDNNDVFPFAVYDEEELIGFMMLTTDDDIRSISIWRFMIALSQQGKGYGRQAMELVLDYIRKSGKYDIVELSCEPTNTVALKLYNKLGFAPTGEECHGEIVLKLRLN